jgi:hypothetical protein
MVRPDDESSFVGQVKAQEMSMNLKTADATLRGNIEPNFYLTKRTGGADFPWGLILK